jgi:hypothetical protein
MYPSSDVDDIRKEIKDHGHVLTNIWNKKQGIKKTLHMFYIELKSKNNKDI